MVWLLRGVARLVAWLPRPAALALGRGIGWVLGRVVRHRRREVEATLARCFPEWPVSRVRGTARAMYAHLGMVGVETLRMSVLGTGEILDGLRIVGEANLQTARDGPALCLMAHLGNWEACSAVMQAAGVRGAVVVKRIKNEAIQQHITETRRKQGLEVVDRTDAFRPVLRLLRDGVRVAIVLDQNTTRSQGVFVDFFGRPACTSAGLAVLSAVAAAPVLPMFCIRRADGGFDAHVLPPLDPPASRKPEAIREATQRYTGIIEAMIRKHPEQWIWLHRRWRTQPLPEAGPAAAGT